jgi:hypothetical protein
VAGDYISHAYFLTQILTYMNNLNVHQKVRLTIVLIGIVIAAIVIYKINSFFDGITEPPPSTTESRKSDFNKGYAYVAAEGYLQNILLAPSTAQFNTSSENGVIRVNDSTWWIDSYVDSQNSYGAMLRKRFICKLTYNPATDETKCLDVRIVDDNYIDPIITK